MDHPIVFGPAISGLWPSPVIQGAENTTIEIGIPAPAFWYLRTVWSIVAFFCVLSDFLWILRYKSGQVFDSVPFY